MRNTKYTTEEYINQIKHRLLTPLDEYQGAHKKITHLCLVCNHQWKATPGSIRNGHGCPSCYQQTVRKPLDQVVSQLSILGWELVNNLEYRNSYTRLTLKHHCGEIVKSNLDRVLRRTKRCLICEPIKLRKRWSLPCSTSNRTYSSKLEMVCSEFLISKFGINDIILQKPYSIETKQTADVYIKSIDTYVEISSINKLFYLERIMTKRRKVKNFIFVSSLEQLQMFFN